MGIPTKVDKVEELLKAAIKALEVAMVHVDDHEGRQTLDCLVDATNAVDEAQDIITGLIEPEPTRSEWEGD